MSLILRHRPEEIGLELEPGGWVRVDELVRKGRERAGAPLSPERIRHVIEGQQKPRFSLTDDGERIRANYGHSVDVDLDLRPAEPPNRLYHGTAKRSVDSILESGLKARSRRYVHLSTGPGDAREVGERHGTPRVLRIRAGRMHGDGHAFYHPAEGIWLTHHVPPTYLEIPSR